MRKCCAGCNKHKKKFSAEGAETLGHKQKFGAETLEQKQKFGAEGLKAMENGQNSRAEQFAIHNRI